MIRTRDYDRSLADLEGRGSISVVVEPVQLAGGAYTVDARITGAVDGVPLAFGHSDPFRVDGLVPGDALNEGVFVPLLLRTQVCQADSVTNFGRQEIGQERRGS